jgi:thiazole/oxazole-forming peptide maturase SagD family component
MSKGFPWVFSDDSSQYALCPKLALYLADGTSESIDNLLRNGCSFGNHDVAFMQTLVFGSSEGLSGYVLVRDTNPYVLHAAYNLVFHLNLQYTGRRWFAIKSPRFPKNSLGSVVVNFNVYETLDRDPVIEKLIDRGCKVIWLGETEQGLQIGPTFCFSSEYQDYLREINTWSDMKTLASLNIRKLPLSATRLCIENPGPLATFINTQIFNEYYGHCIDVTTSREVLTPGALNQTEVDIQKLISQQSWGRGILKNIVVKKVKGLPIYLSSCMSPCNGQQFYESNSGKGLTYQKAEITLVGEAIERFVANEVITGVPSKELNIRDRQYSYTDFHPIKVVKLSDHLMIQAVDRTQNSPVFVPSDLVFFPALHDGKSIYGDTSGLAAHTDLEKAILSGLCELIERNNFYPNFLYQIPAILIDSRNCEKTYELSSQFEKKGCRVFLFRYPDPIGIHVTHCVLINEKKGIAARGSGLSILGLRDANEKALAEATQIYQAQINEKKLLSEEQNPLYLDWRNPEVIAKLTSYFDQSSVHDTDIASASMLSKEKTFDEIICQLKVQNKPVIFHQFKEKVAGWHVVRVMVPGFTLNQYRTTSLGGERIINAPYCYNIPT